MFDFKRAISEIDFDLMVFFVKAVTVMLLLIVAPIKCNQYFEENSVYQISIDEEGLRLDGECKLNVLYYIYDFNLEVARDINSNVIWCKRIQVTYDEMKNTQWR